MPRLSAWQKGVDQYAKELKRDFRENYGRQKMTEEKLLNGAENWKEYSWGGNSLIFNNDISERLSSPSVHKKHLGKMGQVGSWANMNEQWLDTQARALSQAAYKLLSTEKKGRR